MALRKDQAVKLARKCLDNAVINEEHPIPPDSSINVSSIQPICRLWGGKGSIYLVTVSFTSPSSPPSSSSSSSSNWKFIVKHITGSSSKKKLSFGDRRKADSYVSEANFYLHVAPSLENILMLPRPFYIELATDHDDGNNNQTTPSSSKICQQQNEIMICMSYLQPSQSYYEYHDERKAQHLVLDWLAKFHASHWEPLMKLDFQHEQQRREDKSSQPFSSFKEWMAHVGIQRHGNYWHLQTRPDEHSNMSDYGWEGRLKRAASAIDACLRRDNQIQCIIHGDPKSENVVIMKENKKSYNRISSSSMSTSPSYTASEDVVAAMYDFQYCGQGCPTQDLAYFLCSTCDIDQDEDELVSYYYAKLVEELQQQLLQQPQKDENGGGGGGTVGIINDSIIPSIDHLKQSLDVAYADYCRFMCGWGFWGTSSSDVQRRTQSWLRSIDNGVDLGSEEAYDDAIRSKYW